MHEEIVRRLIEASDEKINEARETALQVPDQLGDITRREIEAALSFTEKALRADITGLRGDVAAAYAKLWRHRFSPGENLRLFSALADVRDTLMEIEQAAAAAEYPASEATIFLPTQHLVPRKSVAAELETLEGRLTDLDAKLEELATSKDDAGASSFQVAIIESVVTDAGAKSEMVRDLASETQVDIKGLAHIVEGIGRIVEAFQMTVAPAKARVTSAVKAIAKKLSSAASGVTRATMTLVRTVLSRTEKRFALVIGNASYLYASKLRNPKSDAPRVANVLEGLGFTVSVGIDLDRYSMEGALSEFEKTIEDADVALLYYAGHGLQIEDEKYLLPVDAQIETAEHLNWRGFHLQDILSLMSKRARTNLLFLDTGPRTQWGADLGSQLRLPPHTFVAHSTEPRAISFDGPPWYNSPFTDAFLKHMVTPGKDIHQMMTAVINDVRRETNGKMVPYFRSSLTKPFYFNLVPT